MTVAQELITLTIDGREVRVPPGTLVIRAAESIGVQIPRFCDHPLLDPVGACRQCLVEVEGQRKPMASCTIPVTEGMVVRTQRSSEAAAKAQSGVMELLLINHPLDCPVCDKGGECPLQNQAMSSGRAESRFEGRKRTYPKPIAISEQVLLDRERCVLCARCTRFSEQVAGDPFIELMERGALQQVGIYADEPYESYFSGNAVQICPVGALTGAKYRFRARPFDLVSSPSVCEHCASGCAQRTDYRRGTVLRRMAGDDPDVNEEWNCDKGRWAFAYPTLPDRLDTPLVDGEPASWSHALAVAARGLNRAHGGAGVLVGGRVTAEDAYAYSKFARMALGSNDIDFRVRAHSIEESGFLASRVAGRPLAVTYADLAAARTVLLVGFEPEEESPIVYLRLRRAVRGSGLVVHAIAPYASRGLEKLSGRLIRTVPGAEPAALDALASGATGGAAGTDLLLGADSVIVVGERLAGVRGGFTAAAALADRTGARLAWIPRRAGERGALEAGALPELLPGGRPVADAAARQQVARAWGVDELPVTFGNHADRMFTAALHGFVVGGVDPYDLPQADAMLSALEASPFVVSLELRRSAVTELADVVFPVAAVVEKRGTFLDWEGRPRRFDAALHDSGRMADHRVLDALAREMGMPIGTGDVDAIRREIAGLGSWAGEPGLPHPAKPSQPPTLLTGEAILATWHLLLDDGRLQDGDPNLAATARRPVARLSAATAAAIGVAAGEPLSVGTDAGSITLPLDVVDMADGVVWLPQNSPGSAVHARLGVTAGAVVRIGAGR